MKSIRRLATLVAGVALLSLFTVANAQAGQRYIVLLNNHDVPASFEDSVSAAGGQVIHSFNNLGIAIAFSDSADFADNMNGMPGVKSVGAEAVHGIPDMAAEEPLAHEGPTADDFLYNAGLVWGVQRVHAPEAWDADVTGSDDTVVAVIDTGIAWNHPDLSQNVVFAGCYASVPCNPYPSASDHGTHVAGTIAAAFGGGGVIGVAPNVGLAGYNTFEDIPGCGNCSYTSSRWAAMLDAADRGFDIISMSLGSTAQLGGPGSDGLATFLAADNRVANAVINAGTAIVASAGNLGLDLNGTIVHIPGDLPGIVNVGATGIFPIPRYPMSGNIDIRAFYSNYGAPLTVAGPGGDCGDIDGCSGNPPGGYPWFEHLILSTIVFEDPGCAATYSCPVGYGWKAGTSMATPHVSGVAALIKDQNPDLSARQLANIVKRTAENLGDRQQFGHGMVDARAAIDE